MYFLLYCLQSIDSSFILIFLWEINVFQYRFTPYIHRPLIKSYLSLECSIYIYTYYPATGKLTSRNSLKMIAKQGFCPPTMRAVNRPPAMYGHSGELNFRIRSIEASGRSSSCHMIYKYIIFHFLTCTPIRVTWTTFEQHFVVYEPVQHCTNRRHIVEFNMRGSHRINSLLVVVVFSGQ